MLDLSIVIQAGGKSSRMGTDKALVAFRGAPLLRHILSQTAQLALPTLIITNQPAGYLQFGLPLHGDIHQDWGALGGLHAAIYHAPTRHCLVLACDMPFVNLPLLQHLIALAEDFDAIVPRLTDEKLAEPFRAVYSRACLPAIEAAIAAGKRRVNSFFDQVNIRYVDQPEIEQYDPRLLSFFNVNTPEELALAEQMDA